MTGLRIRPRRLGGEALPRYGLEIWFICKENYKKCGVPDGCSAFFICFAMPVQGRLI